jgi:putative resolvase
MSSVGRLLRVKEAALLLNVSRKTVWKWIRDGRLKGVRLPSGRYRVPEGEVVRILQGERS